MVMIMMMMMMMMLEEGLVCSEGRDDGGHAGGPCLASSATCLIDLLLKRNPVQNEAGLGR